MDSTRIKLTASGFWQAFDLSARDASLHSCFVSYADHLRCRCLLGLTAVESTLSLFWKTQLAHDWAEQQSLLLGLLEDSEALSELQSLSGKAFTRSQWSASLRFLCHLGSPREFEPELADLCVLVPVWGRSRWKDSSFRDLCHSMFELLRCRARCMKPGLELSELAGHETLRALGDFRKHASLLHPAFHELLAETSDDGPGSQAA